MITSFKSPVQRYDYYTTTNNKDIYLRECLLDVHLSSIRPSTQHSLTTITT